MRFAIFVIVISLVWIGGVSFIGSRLINHSGIPKKYRRPIWIVWLIFNALVLSQMASRFSYGPQELHWFALIGFAFVSVLFFLVIVSECIQLIFKLGKRILDTKTQPDQNELNLPRDEGKRTLIRSVLNSTILFSAAGSTAIGVRTARRTPKTISVEIPIEDLHRDLEGLTIVQFSDLHVGPTIKKPFVERTVKIINALKPDIIAFTGDLADGLPSSLHDDVEPLRNLKAKLGKYYVNGNHEYYWDAPAWIDKANELGFIALTNSHRIVDRGEANVLIAGVYDRKADRIIPAHKSSPETAIKNAKPHDVSILLAHRPNSVYDAIEFGFDLQLSGHTHGGQFWPWNMFIGLAHEFSAGLGRYQDKMWVYVNRGTGYWGPPVRTGVPPEITKLTLTKK